MVNTIQRAEEIVVDVSYCCRQLYAIVGSLEERFLEGNSVSGWGLSAHGLADVVMVEI